MALSPKIHVISIEELETAIDVKISELPDAHNIAVEFDFPEFIKQSDRLKEYEKELSARYINSGWREFEICTQDYIHRNIPGFDGPGKLIFKVILKV